MGPTPRLDRSAGVNWLSLTHGTPGLLLAYGLTLIPLLAALIQQRVPMRGLLMAPVVAVPAAVVGILVGALLGSTLPVTRATAAWTPAIASIVALILVGYAAGLLLTRQRRRAADAHKRGTVVEPIQRPKTASPGSVTLAGVEIPLLDETKHFKLIGTTGSGKSTAIRELLTGALQRGDRAIIADPDGSYLARFYRPERGDVILNPFDARSARWDLFGEIDQPYDVEQLARSLIPEGPDPAGHEWRGFARSFLSAVLEYCKVEEKTDLGELYRLLVVAEIDELQDVLAGSAAQPLLAGSDSRMFRAARGTATPVFNALKYAKAGTGAPLSVRRWIREGRGVLFLPYQASQIAALKNLIATWLRVAIFETMSLGEGDHRLWFAIDELDALGQIDGLKDALARLRKFGGRCIIGLQSIAQLRGNYGDAEAQTICENCGNTVVLRCSASERGGTAEFASRLIGKREVIRQHISHSRPTSLGGSTRETRSISEHHTTEDAVMASEIEQLPDLTGFLKIASQPQWRRVELVPKEIRM
jgi:type IV secretory pathway TraG/TraD family ATPase VirD4